MARSNQGLQIVLILFVFLAAAFGITAFIGLTNWDDAAQERDRVTKELADEKKLRNAYNIATEVLKKMIGEGNLTNADMKEQLRSLSVEDATVFADIDAVNQQYTEDMKLFSPSYGGDEDSKNWRSLFKDLVAVYTSANESIDNLNKRQIEIQANSLRDVQSAQAAQKKAEDALAKAERDLDDQVKQKARIESDFAAATAKFQKDIVRITGEKEKNLETYQATIKERDGKIASLADTVKIQAEELEKYRPKEYDVADGRIVSANFSTVYINLGKTDLLRPQTSFSVYKEGTTRFTDENKKGEIRVIRVTRDHLAEAKVLNSDPSDPIIANDLIYSSIYSPGRVLQFALAGNVDLDGDGQYDNELLKSIISRNGGEVVAELTPAGERVGDLNPRLRYVIVGDEPSDKAKLDAYQDYLLAAKEKGVGRKHYENVLLAIDRKPRSTRRLGASGSEGFKTRRPPARGTSGGGF